MQKKSLLVALFCGALCLTGCLKNEESASVAQVRIAKANELNSIADLNKAKAQAEVIYANAEATIANAEAKLREAQANLVNAQAETEKVQAELLKVQVKLAEVVVDEEKVKLQLLEADLQKHLAEVQAAVAKAEAEKQAQINALENAIAQADVDAVNNALALLKAENAVEEYLLTLAEEKAEAAEAASVKYFAALRTVQALQTQQLQTRAEKALVEAGAIEVRDAIHYAIDKLDDEIAKKEALVEYLKEYQTMTPEEAEEALKGARTALNEAYNEYKAAAELENAADDSLNGNDEKGITGIKNMKADYLAGNWKTGENAFKDDFKEYVGDERTEGKSDVYRGGHGDVDGVQYFGVYVADEDDDPTNYAFIPLWTTLKDPITHNYNKWAAEKKETERYPDIDVYEGENKDFIVLTTTTITPAKIDFENVNDVLDGLVAEAEAVAEAEIKEEEEVNIPKRIERWQETIDAYEDKLALHKQYVDARKAAVKAAEDEYIAAFKANEQHKQDIEDAWLAFRDYMLVNHDVDRMLFLSQNDSAKAYDTAKAAKNTAKDNLDAAKAALTESESALQTAKENEAKAQGEYNSAPGVPAATEQALIDAEAHWNPKFNAETAKCENPTAEVGHTWASYNGDTKITGSEAKDVQNKLMNAKDSLKIWQKAEYDAQMALWRNPSNADLQTAFNTAKTNRVKYEGLVSSRQTDENTAANLYAEAKRNYDAADKRTAEKEKWNPEFQGYTNPTTFVTSNKPLDFPVTADTTGHLKKALSTTEAKWMKAGVVAGSSQGALIDALLEYNVNYARVNKETYPKSEQKTEKAILAEATAAEAKAKLQYEHATQKLIAALKHVADWTTIDLTKETIEDYLDENAITLWEKYQTVKKAQEVDLEKAWQKVAFLYWYNPNHIDAIPTPDYPSTWTEDANLWPNESDAQYSWWRSSFYVDYEAQMLDKKTAEYYPIALKVFGQVKHHGEYVYVEDENGDRVKAENVWYWDYNTLPDATFKFSAEEHEIPVAKCWASPSYQIEKYQSFIDGKDEYLAGFKEDVEEKLKTYVEGLEAIRPKVNSYEAHEASYLAWIDEIGEAEAALNEAKKATFDAKQKVEIAQAIYDALDAVANGGMWVYDPDAKLYMKIYNEDSKPEADVKDKWEDGFTWITINEEIARLEGTTDVLHEILGNLIVAAITGEGEMPDFEEFDIEDLDKLGISPDSIAGLSFAKKFLQEVLKQGKISLQVVLASYDEELAMLDEQIDLYTKLAAIYKGIMNANLGIVEESDGETGPLDGEGEGDDEE